MNKLEQLELTKKNIELELQKDYQAAQLAQAEQEIAEENTKRELEQRFLYSNYYLTIKKEVDEIMEWGNIPTKNRAMVEVSWLLASSSNPPQVNLYKVRDALVKFYGGKAYIEEK